MAEIINREQYDTGRVGCATPEHARVIGRHFMRRTILQNPLEDSFAREATVKVTSFDENSFMSTITLERIADDGRPMGEDMINIDASGTIIGDDLSESGYLLGGTDPGPEGWNLTRDELLFPMLRDTTKVVRREDLKVNVLQLPLPEYPDEW